MGNSCPLVRKAIKGRGPAHRAIRHSCSAKRATMLTMNRSQALRNEALKTLSERFISGAAEHFLRCPLNTMMR